MINYREYLNCVLIKSVKSLFDEKLQAQAWGKGDYKMYADFSEITMSFMEDCEPVLEDYTKYGLTKKIKEELAHLYKMVDEYSMDPNRPNKEQCILTDPKWDRIRKYARGLYKELLNFA